MQQFNDLSVIGAAGETRTHAAVISRPTPLAGEPLHQLGYYRITKARYFCLLLCQLSYFADTAKVGFEPTTHGLE